ncbi:MAG TPA: malate synthase A [Propionibacteriaceae bacterium]
MIMTILDERPQTTTPPARPSALLEVNGISHPGFADILTPGALEFVARLQRRFGAERRELLARRSATVRPIAPRFGADTAAIRADQSWRVAPPAPGLEDRRCEITGPPTRATTVEALNSGARVWMADFEDLTSPTWFNMIDGQRNLFDAIRRQIDHTDETGHRHELGAQTATIMVRPRGWHLPEHHLRLHGEPVSGALVDFGLYFFHNATRLIENGQGPYFYLAKLESRLEARLWRDVFAWSEAQLGLEPGTIRATCLIETFPAAFQMTEILYELRDYSAGLTAGRWDYLFSVLKNHAHDRTRLLPDRDQLTMTVPFMRAYTALLTKTCHERGAQAIDGMADKTTEVEDGFDGSWVTSPGLVPACIEVFDRRSGDRPHQIGRRRDDVLVGAAELDATARVPGDVTLHGLRTNIRVSLAYLRAWIEGRGAVEVDHLMEDTATVEISRMQIWQWIRHGARTTEGVVITRDLVAAMVINETLRAHADGSGADHHAVEAARDILEHGCLQKHFPSFLIEYAYVRYLTS